MNRIHLKRGHRFAVAFLRSLPPPDKARRKAVRGRLFFLKGPEKLYLARNAEHRTS
jgi:hypothetical protein